MTLVELLVAVAVLVMLMAAFGTVMNSTRAAVSTAEEAMDANNAAAAIGRLVRHDVERLSRDGGMAIHYVSPGSNRLMFTAVGDFDSVLEPISATAARIEYGAYANPDSPGRVLWRRAMLLNPAYSGRNDHLGLSLAQHSQIPATGASPSLASIIATMADPAIILRPNSLSDVQSRWPLVYESCARFTVEWTTDGTTWNVVDAATPTRAWEQDDTDWPVALRIRYECGVGDGAQTYEIIIEVPNP